MPVPTGCEAYDAIGIGGKIEYNVAYGVTSCERLTSATVAAINEWDDLHEERRLALFAACNNGIPTNSPWLRMRCNHACRKHYRIRTIDGELGAEVCRTHPDGSGCVDTQFADGYERHHWALACAPAHPPPISPPPWPPGMAPLPPPPTPPPPHPYYILQLH